MRLLRARDESKDQSYFLHGVAPEALASAMFPLGEMRKDEVRRRAHAAGLRVFDKPDSTGICFIGERPFPEFLGRHLRDSPGPIETPDGSLVGEHRGLAFYTLGQRSGLGVGGKAGSAEAPWYVAGKDARRNALIVVQDHEHPLLMSDAFEVHEMHWLVPAGAELECAVKTRYRQSDLSCRVLAGRGARVEVRLRRPARAVTPGQYAVFYDGELCLGGGVIAARRNSAAAPGVARETPSSLYSMEGS
jgi:tRNA-specific 2-thiouridylase